MSGILGRIREVNVAIATKRVYHDYGPNGITLPVVLYY